MKITKEKGLILLGIFLTLTVSLSVSIMGRISDGFDISLFVRYVLVGLAGTIYAYILMLEKLNYALKVFYVGLGLSTLVLLFGLSQSNEGFKDLGTFLLWMMIMLGTIALGLVLEFIMHLYHKRKGTDSKTF